LSGHQVTDTQVDRDPPARVGVAVEAHDLVGLLDRGISASRPDRVHAPTFSDLAAVTA
jgi:hypothetical protein